jgi:hypothetical protein
MFRVVSDATDESVPVVEAMDHIDATCDELSGEIIELEGGNTIYGKVTEKGFRDRLAKATKFHDETTEAISVLYD